MFALPTLRRSVIMAAACFIGPLGCNFTMEPDPGATEPSVFDEEYMAPGGPSDGSGGQEAGSAGAGGAGFGGQSGDPALGGVMSDVIDFGVPILEPDAGEGDLSDAGGEPLPPSADLGVGCVDRDGDGVCDEIDLVCNADGEPVTCMAAQPACPEGRVPEAREGCFTGVCVTWDECGEVAPCPDADADGVCDGDDLLCDPDGAELVCDRDPPPCPDDQVPMAEDGCYTGECVTWAACRPLPPCADVDHDGTCDEEDQACNTDGLPVMCRRMAPPCPEGQIPEVTDRCYTGRCITWAQCAEASGGGCMADDDCPAGRWCRETLDPARSTCVPYRREGEACGGFVIPSEARRCHPNTLCSDQDPRLPDGPGVCRFACDEEGDCQEGTYCGVAGVCRESGACFLDADCLRPGNDFPAPLCEGWPVCGAEAQCEWYCGDPRCTDLLGVDFGPCAQVLGVARVDGVCMAVSGCQAEGYQLFDDMEACIRGCR